MARTLCPFPRALARLKQPTLGTFFYLRGHTTVGSPVQKLEARQIAHSGRCSNERSQLLRSDPGERNREVHLSSRGRKPGSAPPFSFPPSLTGVIRTVQMARPRSNPLGPATGHSQVISHPTLLSIPLAHFCRLPQLIGPAASG